MAANALEIIKIHERLKQKRQGHDERWEIQAPFIAPSRVGITGGISTGDKLTRGVYDSTTLMACELGAHFIAGNLINPAQQWVNYTPGDFELKRDDAAREWCDESKDRSLQRLASSFFYAEGPECLIDWYGFGTGWLICEEVPQPINRTIRGFRGFYFHAEKTGRFYIEEGNDGRVDRTHREYEMTAQQIKDRWFINNDTNNNRPVPEVVSQAIKENPTKSFKVVHAIYPRPKAEQNGGYTGAGMPWASCWVLLDSKETLYEGGYRVFPVAVPRYQRTPGDAYGRGRGDIAFPDTRTLNSAKRMGFEDWALKIKPPVLYSSDSVLGGTIRLVPGGPTPINTHGRDIRQAIMPWQTGSHPEVSHINEEELRKSIRNIFYVEQILALLEVNKSEMTAFEFARKIELLFKLVGPVYGRVEWEYLYPIIDIIFSLQLHAGDFSPPPPSMSQGSGEIDLEFQNPISKAQRSGDSESFLMALNDIGPYATQFPQTLDWLDPDEVAQGIISIRGLPAKWVRSKEEVDKLRAERAKQEQSDLEMARAGELAKAAGAAAPMITAAKKPNEALAPA